MQVSVETLSDLSRKMTVTVAEEKIGQQIENKLRSLTGKVKVDGFRPGKVPASVVRKMYGPQVREEVLSDLIQSSFYEAAQDQKLSPVGAPEIKANKMAEGEGLEYEATFEVMPEFVLMPIETLEVKKFTSNVTETEVEKMLQKLREQRQTFKPVERKSQTGDRVVISFEGTQDGENFTNGKTEDFPVILGSNQMIPGFEDRLTGRAAGDHFDFDIEFPAEYPGEKLAGKTGHFVIDVAKVEEPELPEMDEKFCQLFGVEGGVDELKTEIRSNMEREMRRALSARTKTSVMDALYEKNVIQLPTVLVKEEIKELLKSRQESARRSKQKLDEEALATQLEPMAKRRVALALLLNNLIDAHGIKVDAERVRKTVEELAASYQDAEDVVRWYYADKGRLQEIENMVMEDQVVDLIIEKAKTSEEAVPFEGLVSAA